MVTDTDSTNKTALVFTIIFSFIAGVAFASFIFIQPLISIFILFVGTAIFAADKVWNVQLQREVLFATLVLIFFGLGTFRYAIKDFHEPKQPSSTGVVISEPEQRENTTRFTVLSNNGEKVLVSTDLYSPARYGDLVNISGKLSEPGIIDDGENRPFDYGAYLSKDDIYYVMNFAEVEIISSGHGSVLKSFLFSIKHNLIDKMREIFTEPQSSLIAGLILAGKSSMPREVLEEFRRSGLIHIVVLSGYNITIIAEFLRRAFANIFMRVYALTAPSSRLRRITSPKMAAGFSIAGIILFVLMTGAEATVVRASIMVLAVILARFFGRNYSAPRALLLAAFLMIINNPKILILDPSFQLSFLAASALIYLVPIFENWFKWISDTWSLRSIIATTLATQVTVLPLLIYFMGNLSLVSVPANILVLALIPVTMLLGFIATLISFVSTSIAIIFSYPAHLLLSWILSVSNLFASLPLSNLSIPNPPSIAVVLAYLIIIIFVWRYRSFSPHSSNSN